ncbi:MAG: hypothetical protein ACRDEA_02740, partial [Microcystaceae cyanobacterium]
IELQALSNKLDGVDGQGGLKKDLKDEIAGTKIELQALSNKLDGVDGQGGLKKDLKDEIAGTKRDLEEKIQDAKKTALIQFVVLIATLIIGFVAVIGTIFASIVPSIKESKNPNLPVEKNAQEQPANSANKTQPK